MTALTDTLLKLSIKKEIKERNKEQLFRTALELLNRRIQTMEVQLQEGRGDYSEQDIEDYELSARFLNLHYGKKYNTKIETL